jgi:hypothetical protein
MNDYTTGTSTVTIADGNWFNQNIVFNYDTTGGLTFGELFAAKRPPTNVDWLNERIDEMRIKL